jgi:hypothetical protein
VTVVTLFDPTQQHSHSSNVKMFIDDASNSTGKSLQWLHEPPTPLKVNKLLRHDAQTWERLLRTSGGLINLTKCLFYVSFWRFDSEGRASLIPKNELPPLLLSSGSSPSHVPVIQYNSDQAHKYLGNHMAPNFQMKTAYSHLLVSSNHFARRLAASPISRRDAWIAYFAVYIPAMIYTFPVTTHIAKSLRTLQSKALRSTLNKLGFNCNTPLAVAFGPSVNLGLSLRDLPTAQGIALFVMLVRHFRSQSDQGCLLFITLTWWQLFMGTSYPLLERPQESLPYDDAHILSAPGSF